MFGVPSCSVRGLAEVLVDMKSLVARIEVGGKDLKPKHLSVVNKLFLATKYAKLLIKNPKASTSSSVVAV